MPKRQKEKQYQSAREHRANQSLRSGSGSVHSGAARPLPFDCCALTLTPYSTPVCTSDGIIFDNKSIMQHLMKHKSDPVTGKKMTSRDLISLNMDRDESTGKWQCPVLNKTFTNRTKVVAIRQRPPGNEANVISYEAYHELNIKAKNNLDLVSGKKFTKDDVITLQDPDDEVLQRLRDIQNFSHISTMREENTRQLNSSASGNVKHSVTASRILEKLDKEKRKRERAAEEQAKQLLKTDSDADKSSAAGSAKEKMSIYTDERRQFFITYKSCAHLNRKHSVFGKVAGGLEILRRLEEVPTDKQTDRPLETIRIEKMEILENPVAEALEIERKRIMKKKEEKRHSDRSLKAAALGGSSSPSKTAALPSPKDVKEESVPSPFVVGKYLKTAKKESKKRAKQSKSESQAGAEDPVVSRLPPPPKKTNFSDFSGW